jgi:SAM-dependent methyltransferase
VTWRELDSAPDRDDRLAFLAAFAALPEVAAAKRRSYELLGARPGAVLLDAGCGGGEDVAALARLVAPDGRVVGVDVSEAALERAGAATAGLAGVELRRADVAALPFPDATFDGVRVDRTLHHVERPEAAVAELVRVTRPGGAIVVSEAPLRGSRELPEARALWPFLPVLFRQAGVAAVALADGAATVEAPPEMQRALGLPPGLAKLRFLYLTATR